MIMQTRNICGHKKQSESYLCWRDHNLNYLAVPFDCVNGVHDLLQITFSLSETATTPQNTMVKIFS